MTIVERRVLPERRASYIEAPSQDKEKRLRFWWQFSRFAKDLYDAIAGLDRVLVINCGATPHMSFAFLPTKMVFAHSLDVFALACFSDFCLVQSRVHEVWARFFASSLEDRLRYTPTDCFETFPFPLGYQSSAALEEAGRIYYDFRADLMARNNEGLTKTYNRFHDPNDDSHDIVRLRELHAAMDRAVLDAYGWQDIQPVCEFIPEFDDDDDEDDNGRPKKRKYRYKWPEAIHDEALARLLELNRQRALEEGQMLKALDPEMSAGTKRSAPKRSKPAVKKHAPSLFVDQEG